MADTKVINTIESFYRSLNASCENATHAELMLALRSWLTEITSFDPLSGAATSADLLAFLSKNTDALTASKHESVLGNKDWVFRIVSHTENAINKTLRSPKTAITRQHTMVPVYAARELDSGCVQWLSRQPGRNVRDKLSGKHHIPAVTRIQSVDTSENRLLKAFLVRLEQVLSERHQALIHDEHDICSELQSNIQRWMRSEDYSDISKWTNTPPNNTLLQDKQYRKIWDGWLTLQSLDDRIAKDSCRLNQDILSFIIWKTIQTIYKTGRLRIPQQPIVIDYDNFSIRPALDIKGYILDSNNHSDTGSIKNINKEKFFGFIRTKDNQDLFFHRSNLHSGCNFNNLEVGNYVSYSLGENKQGICADKIQRIESPSLFEAFSSEKSAKIKARDKEIHINISSDEITIEGGEFGQDVLSIDVRTITELPQKIAKSLINLKLDKDLKTFAPRDHALISSSILDISSAPHFYASNMESIQRLASKLIYQSWSLNSQERNDLNISSANAIYLDPFIKTISLVGLLRNNLNLTETEKLTSARALSEEISKLLPSSALTYIVPDFVNDFDSEAIRKSISKYFRTAKPLPRSIASVFAWQASNTFKSNNIEHENCVLVVEAHELGLAITPIKSIYNENFKNLIPESRGFTWERHPTQIIETDSLFDAFSNNLSVDGCPHSEEVIRLFGLEGLTASAGDFSIVSSDSWFDVPFSIKDDLKKNLDHSPITPQMLNKVLETTLLQENPHVYILPLDDTLKRPNLPSNFNWINPESSLIKGAQTLEKWQDKAPTIALWRDHLPNLSIRVLREGYFENIYLVKDTTVSPELGRRVAIEVADVFTLPPGATHYSFPLQQGEGNKELKFVAYLRSPAFPLEEPVNCKLEMTYTYGADEPYELRFIPLNTERAGFKSVRTEWRPAAEEQATDLRNLPIPDFPRKTNWSEFIAYPKLDGTGTSDLLDWVSERLQSLDQLLNISPESELQEIISERKVGYFEWGAYDRNGDFYCRVNVDGDSVFCHSSRFFEKIDEGSLKEGMQVQLSVTTSDKGSVGKQVTFYQDESNKFIDSLSANIDKAIAKKYEKAQRDIFFLRFPTLTIWNFGHSLSEPDAPSSFRDKIFASCQTILRIIDAEEFPDSLKEELFRFLCTLHKDAPAIVAERLLESLTDNSLIWQQREQIGYALGNADITWQKCLLDRLITTAEHQSSAGSAASESLAVALWRSENLINQLSAEQINKLSKALLERIQFEHGKLIHGNIAEENTRKLSRLFELLLALLRSRTNQHEGFREILAPRNALTDDFLTVLDKIAKDLVENGINLNSRISLQIDKPDIFAETPDLLYALRLYLSGESGANTISITGVSVD